MAGRRLLRPAALFGVSRWELRKENSMVQENCKRTLELGTGIEFASRGNIALAVKSKAVQSTCEPVHVIKVESNH